MFNQGFFIPSYLLGPSMVRGGMLGPAMNGARLATQSLAPRASGSLFSKLGGGIQAIKKINWGGLINNTSKTLNVVNQAIPLVRQVGPMVNNVKSMLKVASVFKDETDVSTFNNNLRTTPNSQVRSANDSNAVISNSSVENTYRETSNVDIEDTDINAPTFFINS